LRAVILSWQFLEERIFFLLLAAIGHGFPQEQRKNDVSHLKTELEAVCHFPSRGASAFELREAKLCAKPSQADVTVTCTI